MRERLPEGAAAAMIESVAAYCAARGVEAASSAEVEAFLFDLLFGERKLWPCYEARIIVRREVCDALTARVFTWLERRARSDFLGGAGPHEEALARSFFRALFPGARDFEE